MMMIPDLRQIHIIICNNNRGSRSVQEVTGREKEKEMQRHIMERNVKYMFTCKTS